MNIQKKDFEQRMKHFETVCRDEGIKLTHQRIEIFREVAQTGDHPDADQIFQRVRDRVPHVSLDTVYRTLWLLNDLGLVVTLGASREPTRFDANLKSHHHFVCRQCGFTS
ncbi:MAG: transcriptional repressor, partial [Desulfobulbus sp.]|nr:transcriptional repressor [Desulfobulbus sp.]